MRVKLLKPYGMCAAGEEIDPRPAIALLLIKRGVAREVEEQPTGAIEAVVAQFKRRPRKERAA